MSLTRGHLLRHFHGKRGGFFPAMLDVAQDHLLAYLYDQGLFDQGLVFKGGTALRKMRAGDAGRFSTDVDFCAPTPGLATLVLDAIDGVRVEPFSFRLAERRSKRADLLVTGPFGPSANTTTTVAMPSKVELSARCPWLPPDILPFLRLPVHLSYELPKPLPSLPVLRLEESVAEKLARYARIPLARDLYDLVWYAEHSSLDEPLVRRLWILKVYYDVVLDGRWPKRTFDHTAILTPRSAGDIDEESIGYLIQPVRIADWERAFRRNYSFLVDLTDDERAWAHCHAADRPHHQQAVASFQTPRPEPTT